jgi:hypothetical protein
MIEYVHSKDGDPATWRPPAHRGRNALTRAWHENVSQARVRSPGRSRCSSPDKSGCREGAPLDTKELKKLAEKYSPDKLETCILQQLSKGKNECELIDETDEVITALSKAEVVRELMDQGKSFSEALRELARRIRAVYGKEEQES